MSTENALEHHIESALLTWIADKTTHTKDFSAWSCRHEQQDASDTMTLPAIVVKATRRTEEVNTGVWECDVEVAMLTQASDTDNTARVQAWNDLMAIIYRDDLASKIAITSTIATYAVRFTGQTTRTESEFHHENRLSFTCWSYSV